VANVSAPTPSADGSHDLPTESYLKRFAGEINTVVDKAAKVQHPAEINSVSIVKN
jgi:hypothetical protein